MPREEEQQARELHRAMLDVLARDVPDAAVACELLGTQSNCTASRGSRSCRVHCFCPPPGPEFYTKFREHDGVVAYGRVRSRQPTIEAITDWLRGVSLPAMYARYAFVDRRKRELQMVLADVLELEPDLRGAAAAELHTRLGDSYELVFTAPERGCKFHFYGDEPAPRAGFSWQSGYMFSVQTVDVALLAAILRRWFVAGAMPSAMKADFPVIDLSPLAPWYERGQAVEGEFVESWNHIEQFFERLRDQRTVPPEFRDFIRALRDAGYGRTTRAGQSMSFLVLSRSRRHGLRNDQSAVSFVCTRSGGMNVVARIRDEPAVELRLARAGMAPEIDAVLQRLVTLPVD